MGKKIPGPSTRPTEDEDSDEFAQRFTDALMEAVAEIKKAQAAANAEVAVDDEGEARRRPPRPPHDGVDIAFPPIRLYSSQLPRRTPLRETYRNQRVRIPTGGRLFDLVIAPSTEELRAWGPGCGNSARVDEFPFVGDVYIVGCWKPAALVDSSQIAERVATARTAAQDLGLDADLVTCVDPRGRWMEAALLLVGVERGSATALARKLGQRYLVCWNGDEVEVIGSAKTAAPPLSSAWQLIEVGPARCPMLLGPAVRRRCEARGGPWVWASRHMWKYWNAQQRVSIELLGCASCHDGKQAAQLEGNGFLIGQNGPIQVTGGQASQLSEVYLPTRTHDWL